MTIVFVIISLVASLILFEAKETSNDPSSRIHARNNFYQNCFKLACIILTIFFTDDSYRWTIIIFMLTFSMIIYTKIRRERPYHRDRFNKIAEVIYCIFIWACCCLVIVMASEDSDFNGGMQVFIIVIPLIGIIVVTRESRRHTLLLKTIDEFDSPEIWHLKIRYYLEIVHQKEVNREAAVQLNGFMFHHEEACTNRNCSLKAYMDNLIITLKDKKKKQQRANTESYLLLMNYAKYLFSEGVKRFPNSSSLHIAYAIFLNDRINDKNMAINELNAAEKSYPQFDEQFLIYRYRKILEDETADMEETSGSGLDVVSMLAYENYLRQFKEAIEKSAYLHMEFWLELSEPEPDLGKLDSTGVKINATILLVQERWKKVQKVNPNVPKALKIYSDYLIEILNDNEEGSELLSRIKDNKFMRGGYAMNILADASALGMGEICATMGGGDGTPCIVASGDPSKLGKITECNMSTCNLFGYTRMQLIGEKVNVLMPKPYAEYHDNILQSNIDKTENNNYRRNERVVLGRHKSGYLLPLLMKTRIAISVKEGAFFVATFQLDKKDLKATYLLLDDRKNVVGMTSKAIDSLKLNNPILHNYGIPIDALAPDISNKSMFSQLTSKNGGNIEFYRPDLVRDISLNVSEISRHELSLDSKREKKLRIKASKDFAKMNCITMEVAYNTHIIGTIVRLEPAEDVKPSLSVRQQKPQTNVQFGFDPVGMKYFQQDCDEDAQELISRETSEYVNILRDKSMSNYSQSKFDDEKSKKNPKDRSYEGDSCKEELNELRKRIDKKKKEFIGEVNTYIWLDGQKKKVVEAQSRLLEKEQEEEREVVEEKDREKLTRMMKEDASSALKSHKIFIETLNDKTTPPSVRRLKYASYFLLLVILIICSVEFGFSISHYSEIEKNINLIRDSYRLIVSQMQMIFYINKIVLIASGSVKSSVNDCKTKIQLGLDEYYRTQNYISLTTISKSKEHDSLFRNKVVYLHYKGGTREDTTKYYTLPEAVQQMSSEIFTVSSFPVITMYTLEDDNVYFVLYNGFADLYIKLKKSTNFFVSELTDRGQYKTKVMIVIFSTALFVLLLTTLIVFPMVAAVSSTRLEVLALFFDLPQTTIRELQSKCEKFVSQNKDEEVEKISITDSNTWLNLGNKAEGFANIGAAQGKKRKYKNNKMSNGSFYIKFIFGMFVIAGYFSVNFLFGYIYLKNAKGYSRELNATSVAHSEFFYAISVLQQLLGHGQLLTLSAEETFDYLAIKQIIDLYSITQEMQISHNEKGRTFTKTYQEAFIAIMRSDLCKFQREFGYTFDCNSFLEGTTREGLHPVLIGFIESIREILTSYKEFNLSNNTAKDDLISSELFDRMEISLFELANSALRYLIDKLVDSHGKKASNDLTQRVILYIVFLLLLFLAFLIFWMPFTNKLSNEVFY